MRGQVDANPRLIAWINASRLNPYCRVVASWLEADYSAPMPQMFTSMHADLI